MGRRSEVVFADLEVGFDVGEVFVGGHGGWRVEVRGGDGGADDVDAVEGGFGVDVVLVAPPGEGRLADVEDEVLADLPLVDHFPGADADPGGVGQPSRGDHGFDLGELGLGGGQQPLAVGGALLRPGTGCGRRSAVPLGSPVS